MSPQTLTLTSHTQRPWRPVGSLSTVQRTTAALVAEHRFAAPVVRELPPRREARAAAGVW